MDTAIWSGQLMLTLPRSIKLTLKSNQHRALKKEIPLTQEKPPSPGDSSNPGDSSSQGDTLNPEGLQSCHVTSDKSWIQQLRRPSLEGLVSPPAPFRMPRPYIAVAPSSVFSVVGELTNVDCAFKLEPMANLLGGRVSNSFRSRLSIWGWRFHLRSFPMGG